MIDPKTHVAMCEAEFAAGRASRDAEVERLKGMVDEIQAARRVNSEHDKLLAQVHTLRHQLSMSQQAKDDATVSAAWTMYDRERMANTGLNKLLSDAQSERDNAWEELRKIREAIHANAEESTLDEVVRLFGQFSTAARQRDELMDKLAAFISGAEHVTEAGCTRRSFVAMPECWAMVHKDRLAELEGIEDKLDYASDREIRLRGHIGWLRKVLGEYGSGSAPLDVWKTRRDSVLDMTKESV